MRNFQKDFIYRRWWHKTKFKYFQQSSHEARNNIQLEACKPINVIIDFKSTKQILLRSFRLCFQFVNGFDILAMRLAIQKKRLAVGFMCNIKGNPSRGNLFGVITMNFQFQNQKIDKTEVVMQSKLRRWRINGDSRLCRWQY